MNNIKIKGLVAISVAISGSLFLSSCGSYAKPEPTSTRNSYPSYKKTKAKKSVASHNVMFPKTYAKEDYWLLPENDPKYQRTGK